MHERQRQEEPRLERLPSSSLSSTESGARMTAALGTTLHSQAAHKHDELQHPPYASAAPGACAAGTHWSARHKGALQATGGHPPGAAS